MKKLKFFLPALAVLFMTGCSSDDPNPGTGTGDDGNAKFISVNIMSTGSAATTRADESSDNNATGSTETNWSNNSFDNGNDDENNAKTVLFVFYQSNDKGQTGVQTQTPQLVNLTEADLIKNPDGTPQSAIISKTVVAIAGKEKPTHMLVILNATEKIRNDLNGTSLQDAYIKIDNYAKNGDLFIMTNSSYAKVDDSNVTIIKATEIGEEQIHDSRAKAETTDKPVQVYVERVVAKVDVQVSTDKFEINPSDIIIDDTQGNTETIKLTPEVVGIEIANVPTEVYLFKNIQNIADNIKLWPGINDYTNKRSYWATTVGSKPDKAFTNRSWTTLDDEEYEFGPQKYYILPNTTTDHLTSVLVTAKLNDKDEKPISLVSWGGSYYLKENFKNQIAMFLNNGGYEIQETESKYRNFVADDIDYVDDKYTFVLNENNKNKNRHEYLVEKNKIKAYQTIGRVKDNLKDKIFQKDDNDNHNPVTDYDSVIEAYLCDPHYVFELWEDGLCYYFAEIEHYPNATTANEGSADRYKFKYGVIRNHVYKLELESLNGLGVPVVNPEEIIIPERPGDSAWYVGAKIHVLKWRVVPTQHVNFGK